MLQICKCDVMLELQKQTNKQKQNPPFPPFFKTFCQSLSDIYEAGSMMDNMFPPRHFLRISYKF